MHVKTKICILYWRDFVNGGCAKAGFHCILIFLPTTVPPLCNGPRGVRSFWLNYARIDRVVAPCKSQIFKANSAREHQIRPLHCLSCH